MTEKPRVGVPSDDYRAVCAYSHRPGDPQCDQPATVHVLSDSPTYGLATLASCPTHAVIARAAGQFVMEHEHAGVCGLPATIWHWLENRCVIDDSGVEPELVAVVSDNSEKGDGDG